MITNTRLTHEDLLKIQELLKQASEILEVPNYANELSINERLLFSDLLLAQTRLLEIL